MIFKRRISDPSSQPISCEEKLTSKVETFYVGIMCFVAACLSYMTLEVGARSPLGHSVTKSATFNAIFRRSYNMKIKIMMTNVVMGFLSTMMLAVGDIYNIPYLHVPWLFNTLKGMILYEGPALLRLSNVWLPEAGIQAGAFIFITLLLFVEEFCLWFDVFSSFKNCCKEYYDMRTRDSTPELNEESSPDKFCPLADQQACNVLGIAEFSENKYGSIVNTTNAALISKPSISNGNIKLRATKSSNDSKRI